MTVTDDLVAARLAAIRAERTADPDRYEADKTVQQEELRLLEQQSGARRPQPLSADEQGWLDTVRHERRTGFAEDYDLRPDVREHELALLKKASGEA